MRACITLEEELQKLSLMFCMTLVERDSIVAANVGTK